MAAWLLSGTAVFAWDIVKHMVLPVVTLTLISFAGTMLLTRSSMLETMREDFVMAARAKGLPERDVRDKHVARNRAAAGCHEFHFQSRVRGGRRCDHRVDLLVARHGADPGFGRAVGGTFRWR